MNELVLGCCNLKCKMTHGFLQVVWKQQKLGIYCIRICDPYLQWKHKWPQDRISHKETITKFKNYLENRPRRFKQARLRADLMCGLILIAEPQPQLAVLVACSDLVVAPPCCTYLQRDREHLSAEFSPCCIFSPYSCHLSIETRDVPVKYGCPSISTEPNTPLAARRHHMI
jgi:hypothetical protein